MELLDLLAVVLAFLLLLYVANGVMSMYGKLVKAKMPIVVMKVDKSVSVGTIDEVSGK